MAKTILTNIFLVATISAYAQDALIFQQNRLLLGGGISFNFSNSDDTNFNLGDDSPDQTYNYSRIIFTPMFGLFSKDYVLLGVKPTVTKTQNENYYSSDSNYRSDNERNSLSVGASLFISHYYPIFKRFGALLEHEVGYERFHEKYKYNNYFTTVDNDIDVGDGREFTGKGNIYHAAISILLYYSINDHFLIQSKIGELSYYHRLVTRTDDQNDGEVVSKETRSSGNLNFITTLSFDKILSFSYIF